MIASDCRRVWPSMTNVGTSFAGLICEEEGKRGRGKREEGRREDEES